MDLDSWVSKFKKVRFGFQLLIIPQFGSNYWTMKLFNMVDGRNIAMENET